MTSKIRKEVIEAIKDLYKAGVPLSEDNIVMEVVNRQTASIIGIPEDADEREEILLKDQEKFNEFIKVHNVVSEYLDTWRLLVKNELYNVELLGGLPYVNPKFIDEEEEKKKKWRKAIGLLVLRIIAGIITAYIVYNLYYNDYLPKKLKEARIEQLKQVGLDEKLAIEFDKSFSTYSQNGKYNSTHLEFAKYYSKNPELSISIFNLLNNNFEESNKVLQDLVNVPNSLEFVKKYPQLITEKKYKNALDLYSKNSTIADILFKNILSDKKISKMGETIRNNALYGINRDFTIEEEKTNIIDFASKLFLDLGYYKKVKVFDPNTNQFREEYLKPETIRAFGNYSVAVTIGAKMLKEIYSHDPEVFYIVYERIPKLPLHDKETLWLFGNATQINPDLVDFEPVVVKGMLFDQYIHTKGPSGLSAEKYLRDIAIESYSIPRDVWMIVEFLKNRPHVINNPKMFEFINAMIQQASWKIFDWEYGPKYFDKKEYMPTDPDVWKIILGFYDYMEKLPENLKKDNIPIVFPYWDSDLLKQQISDRVDRKLALFYLCDIPVKSVKDIPKDIFVESEIVQGIEGMKKFVENLPKVYEKLRFHYLNKTKFPWAIYNRTPYDPRMQYFDGLSDRYYNGLEWTIGKFIGLDDETIIKNRGFGVPQLEELSRKYYGIEKFLTENWEGWDLVKYIYGMARGGYIVDLDEWDTYGVIHPLGFKAFGIPSGGMGIDGTRNDLGGPGNYNFGEFAIYGIPDNVINKLKNEFKNVAIARGNGISWLSHIEGAERDSIYQIVHGIRYYVFFIWRK